MAKPTLRNLAYRAIERDSLSSDKALASEADEAMTQFLNRSMLPTDIKRWAQREREFLQLSGEQK